MNGKYTATIDRIVDGETAVLLCLTDEVSEQFDVAVERLPAGCDAGSVVSVTVDNGVVVAIESDPNETAERRERIREKLDRLSRRLDDSE